MSFFLKILTNSLVLLIFSRILPQSITIKDYLTAIIAALILAFLNEFLKPFLKLIGFPITVLTFGLFSLVINGFILWLVSKLSPGMEIHGFGWAIILAALMGLIDVWLTPKLKGF